MPITSEALIDFVNKAKEKVDKEFEMMKQPKFKFGEKVRNLYHKEPEPFVIGKIHRIWGEFMCGPGEQGADLYSENDLELYQETHEKKLYAYIKEPFEVMFSPLDKLPCSYSWWKRAPEYDITFGEAER